MTPQDLTNWREHWQYSQGQLASALSVRIETVGRWERGVVPVPGWLPLALETLARRRADEYRERARGLPATPKARNAGRSAASA